MGRGGRDAAEIDASCDTQISLRQSSARSYAEAYARFLEAYPDIEEEWRRCEVGLDTVLCLRPDEVEALGQELSAVVNRWTAKCANRSDDEGREVLFVIQGYPWLS